MLVKRGSDLLGMYVGQTEAQIAAAFREARDDNAILVIDEADGFLRDRTGAQRNWEVTQVNELLTQMEAFDGIFIASTNLIDTLDAASLRRFDFKIRFDYLDREQRRALVAKACATSIDARHNSAWTALDRLEAITPGDVAVALRQCKVTGQTPNSRNSRAHPVRRAIHETGSAPAADGICGVTTQCDDQGRHALGLSNELCNCG